MSQCEAQGFRNITYWPDRPDVMSRFTVTISRRQDALPRSAFQRQSGRRGGRGRQSSLGALEDPFKKPCYLFALVAGQFVAREDKIKTKSGREVLLQVWTEEKNYPNSEHALESLKKAIAWDEERWGLELDFDRSIDVVHRRLQLRGYGKQGPQYFQFPLCDGFALYCHRHGLPKH